MEAPGTSGGRRVSPRVAAAAAAARDMGSGGGNALAMRNSAGGGRRSSLRSAAAAAMSGGQAGTAAKKRKASVGECADSEKKMKAMAKGVDDEVVADAPLLDSGLGAVCLDSDDEDDSDEEDDGKDNSHHGSGNFNFNINDLLDGIDGFQTEPLKNLPTKAELEQTPAPSLELVLASYARLSRHDQRRYGGNPGFPPELFLLRCHKTKKLLRKCETLAYGAKAKEKLSEEEKLARKERSLFGATGGDTPRTLAEITEAMKGGKPFRYVFDAEHIAAGDQQAIIRYLQAEVAEDADEILLKLRKEADEIGAQSKASGKGTFRWLAHVANESGGS